MAHVVIKWRMSDEERIKINLKNDDRVPAMIVIFKYYYFIKRVCYYVVLCIGRTYEIFNLKHNRYI